MLGEVQFIRVKNPALNILHLGNVPGIKPFSHRLRHAPHNIVSGQKIRQPAGKSLGYRLFAGQAGQEGKHFLFTVSQGKFKKTQGPQKAQVNLSDRKRKRFGQSYAKQRARAGDVVLRGVFIKVFKRGKRAVAELYLVKNKKRLPRFYSPAVKHSEFYNNALGIKITLETFMQGLIALKIKIGHIIIGLFTEFFKQIGFTGLAHAFKQQRFTIFLCFPFNKLGCKGSFH